MLLTYYLLGVRSEVKMADFEVMDIVNDATRNESEIFVSIKTPQDIRKVMVYRAATVKQVGYNSVIVCVTVSVFRYCTKPHS